MSSVTGIVASKSRAGTGIKVDDVWYNGTREQLANVNFRATVELTADNDRKITAVKVLEDNGTSPAAQATAPGFDARQEVIVFQSARNAAIELFAKLQATGAIKLPTKQADQYGAAMAFINEHTAEYHKQAMAIYNNMAIEEVLGVE